MFGALKKKLQEAINKLTGKAEEKKEETVAEKIEEKIEQKIEKLQELEERIEEEKLPAEIAESVAEEKVIYEEIKKEEQKPVVREVEEILKEKPKAESPSRIPEPVVKEVEEIFEKEEEKKEEAKPLAVAEKPAPPLAEKPGFIRGLIQKITEKKLDDSEIEKFLRDLQIILLENDVALETAERICDDVKQELKGKSVKRGEVEKAIKSALRNAMLDVMKQPEMNIEELIEKKYGETKKPFLIVFFGFNGSGKTTSIAKLAHLLKKYRPVIAAGDTFRAASIEQLEHHGQKLGVDVVKQKYGSDSAAVIFDAVKHAQSKGSKLVLADTAGRSHSNINLMDELRKIVRVNSPDMRVLVLDSITGNDIYDQSRLFNEAAGVDAIILTKADVYEKGGAALSATHTIKKPVLFLGVGQEYDDLKEFDPEYIVNNLLG